MRRLLGTALCSLLTIAGPVAGQAPGGETIEVPLRMQDGHLIVPVTTPAGTELSFALSTGSAVAVLTESGARRVGDLSELWMGGVAVAVEGSQSVPDASLTVGGTVLDGMIGANTLNRFDMLVDLPRGRLVLKPIGRSVAWEGVALSEPVRLRVYHGIVLALDVELNGKRYPAMLDLGTSTLLANQGALDGSGVSAGGKSTLRIGSISFPDLPVALSDHPVIQRFSPSGDGFVLVGSPIAADCAISVSWVHREIRTCVR